MPRLPLPDPVRTALFLDVDGTLLEIAPAPQQVRVSARLKSLLGRLHATLGGALALISGRSLETLDGLFAPLVLPAAGIHGLQRRNGGLQRAKAGETPSWHRTVAHTLEQFAATHPGLQIEDKGHALALHFRRAPDRAAAAEQLAEELLAGISLPVQLIRGKMVLEFLPAGANKGQAIREFMAEPPFARRQPVFIGDDLTDEAGFSAVNELGGLSIRVGADIGTAARYRLRDVGAVYDWLSHWPADAQGE